MSMNRHRHTLVVCDVNGQSRAWSWRKKKKSQQYAKHVVALSNSEKQCQRSNFSPLLFHVIFAYTISILYSSSISNFCQSLIRLFISKPFCRLLIKASGTGDYWGDYQDVKCKVYFKAEPYHKDDDERTYLNVESVKMDFSVKDIEMGVENDNNNRVIRKLDEYLHWH